MKLHNYERHYILPALVTAEFCFSVDGDNRAGHEIPYEPSNGLVVPIKEAWPVVLHSLRAEFIDITLRQQVTGLVMAIWARPTNRSMGTYLAHGVTSPLTAPLSWAGNLPNDWGYGCTVFGAAGLTTTHKLVIAAQYEERRNN